MSRWVAPPMAWPRGQIEDRVKSLGPGQGRLHWQRWPNGREETHHDQFDPARGAGEAIIHVLLETPIVPIMVGVAVVGTLTVGLVRALTNEA